MTDKIYNFIVVKRLCKMNIASIIDHTMLKPDAVFADIRKLCLEAKKWHFASVCVNSCHTSSAAELLKGSDVKVCTVVGFPLGAAATAVKVFEAQNAFNDGADEIDMVINISWLKDKFYEKTAADIASVVSAVPECKVKVIIETCLLTKDEIVTACKIAKSAGAHFVKTSTGFSKGGAGEEDVRLMRSVVGSGTGVKASGGIRDYETAIAMVRAGADRLGTSQSLQICEAAEDF